VPHYTALGAKVIAAGSSSKLDVARKYGGADYVVDYTKPEWQKEVLKITNGKGVNVVYDPVGRIRGLSFSMSAFPKLSLIQAILECLKCIAFKGRAVVVGFAGGQIEKVRLPILNLYLTTRNIVLIHSWGNALSFH
jgi:NADPH2:quinone reductase